MGVTEGAAAKLRFQTKHTEHTSPKEEGTLAVCRPLDEITLDLHLIALSRGMTPGLAGGVVLSLP